MARTKRANSVRSRVREYMQVADGNVSVGQVSKVLKVTPKEAGSALASLVRSGVLTRAGRGWYAYATTSTLPTVDDIVKVRESAQVTHYEGDSPIVTDDAATSDDTFIDWFSAHLGVDPDRVAVAIAYYDMFVAESGTDARVTR